MSNLSVRTVELDVAGKSLVGKLTVPEGTESIVVFSAGTCGAQHASLETEMATRLHSQGIATLLLELISTDDTDERAVRADSEKLTDRLEAQLEWLDSKEPLREMSVALCGTGSGAGAALDYLAASDGEIAGIAFLNGRLDIAIHPSAGITRPVLFYLEAAYNHLEGANEEAYEQAAVSDRYKHFLTVSNRDALDVVAQWYSWVFRQSTKPSTSAAAHDHSEIPRNAVKFRQLRRSE